MAANPTDENPLEAIEATFLELCTGVRGVWVDGRDIGPDLPPRVLSLAELRELLLGVSTAYDTKDRALALLVARARTDGDLWWLGLTGLLMPGLRRVSWRLEHELSADTAEVGAEVLVAFVAAVTELEGTDRVAARLLWEVYRRALRALRRAAPPRWLSLDRLPRWPAAGPTQGASAEMLVMGAVRAGVLLPEDAELIALTRLDRRQVLDISVALGVPSNRLVKRRARAEARLVELLRDDPPHVADPDFLGDFWREGAAGRGARRYLPRPGARTELDGGAAASAPVAGPICRTAGDVCGRTAA